MKKLMKTTYKNIFFIIQGIIFVVIVAIGYFVVTQFF